jgi:NAD(P)-dependent dehydrogenase (short-subunit alcohol dehydrogenase family)
VYFKTTPLQWQVKYNINVRIRSAERVMNDMNTNFVGPINVTNAVLPSMRERRDGTIVFVGSRSAYRTSIPVSPPSFTTFVRCLTLFRAPVSTQSQRAEPRPLISDLHSRL